MAETGCPCGVPHEMTPAIAEAYAKVTAGLPASVTVRTSGGTFRVPRLFIACHGLKADELPVLAGRYGFERIDG